MSGLIFIIICLGVGKLLSRLTNPQELIRTLNLLVVRVALPALILDKIHTIHLEGDAFFPILSPWIAFIVAVGAIYAIRFFIPFSKVTTGCLILICGTSNTSFVGFPLLQAILGHDALNVAIIVDQSNLILLFTMGILVANLYSGTSVNFKQIFLRLLIYPPVVALILGVLLRPIEYPEAIEYALSSFGSLLTPLTMLSIGCSLSLPRDKSMIKMISIGLIVKLIIMPLSIAIPALFIFDHILSPMTAMVTILEIGMAPMVMSVIIAADKNLDPELANFLTSIGIPVSFVTIVLWHLIIPLV
ncbi:AEC family transporter [Wohlfahrtiimonas chitiniclastica]|uniref:AEC family transporter n=1 Tax=Wohlfahrtiimonas chitiniclastica TaxID=400946 RepID=UPI001BD17633|nr:AEC family transporter [Wohlfahrtiimonas chitiniclastica]MBS7814718.1 AEC family transporter [Wohlfahrtiimonas chitiniclastica]